MQSTSALVLKQYPVNVTVDALFEPTAYSFIKEFEGHAHVETLGLAHHQSHFPDAIKNIQEFYTNDLLRLQMPVLPHDTPPCCETKHNSLIRIRVFAHTLLRSRIHILREAEESHKISAAELNTISAWYWSTLRPNTTIYLKMDPAVVHSRFAALYPDVQLEAVEAFHQFLETIYSPAINHPWPVHTIDLTLPEEELNQQIEDLNNHLMTHINCHAGIDH